MTKQKRSFMEKLIGSRNRSEDAENEPVSMDVLSDEEDRSINVSDSNMASDDFSGNNWDDAAPEEETGDGQLTIDVYQTDDDIVIKSTIAGVKPEDLDVSINNDMLTIKGERKFEDEVSEENFYYQECYWGGFSRSVVLPVDVIPEKIEATLKNGILTIKLPKASANKTRKIKVRGF
ncbi:MAG: Hsp20/alpha crystallin family protein [Candidatus Moranbacteria bacterium]|nr:Hsp20/alpha crystallin family protein [Candidatus Moranbacteria bacterium]MDD5652053.1 Hsp20/alpha crystallin family protein [Candidatus Moranbacteria bacterium]